MRKYLLPENAKYYKANLHSHTVLSDGLKTPEQLKADYMSHGYSIIAFTDHDKYYQHNDLTDENFVALNGFELEYYIEPWHQKTCHICYIAKTPDNVALGYSSPEPPIFIKEIPEGETAPEKGGLLYKVTCPARRHDPDYINEDMKKAKELGFYITYNHPTWSLESYPDYSRYHGMDAMEISNYDCVIFGYNDDDGRVYDDLLNLGNRIYCTATDDNHNDFSDDSERSDSYGGYIMLAAENLKYEDVIKALEEGKFYACGKVNPGTGECPQIKNLWAEDGKIHIETTEAANITFVKDKRPFGIVVQKDAEHPVTEAEFSLDNESKWFRIVVTGENGCKAYTSAYFVDNL